MKPTAKTPSIAQAKKLAWLFQADRYLSESADCTTPTDAVLVKQKWVTATGTGTHPSGTPFTKYVINDDGLFALERYLWNRRTSQVTSKLRGGE